MSAACPSDIEKAKCSPFYPMDLIICEDGKGLLNGERARILLLGQHPITKEWFRFVVERERDLAIIGLK